MARFVPVFARFIVCAGLSGLSVALAHASAARQDGAPATPTPPVLPDPIVYSVQTPPPPPSSRAASSSRLPAMGRVQIFENWAVACDNRMSCSAVALLPEETTDPYPILPLIRRDGGPDGAVSISFLTADPLRGKVAFMTDNRRIAELKARQDGLALSGMAALDMIRTMGRGFSFELRQGKSILAQPSLAGLSAALRVIDQQQGRIGLRDALVATGDGDPATVKAVPVPDGAGASQAPAHLAHTGHGPASLTASEEAAARKLALCEGSGSSAYPLELHVLDATHILALLPCDAGAYNVSFVPLVGTGSAGSRSFAVAPFDFVPGDSGDRDAPPIIINARWNARLGILSGFAKGRGLGDCGTSEDYGWDGARFRLREASAMPVCRGAWEWPRIYSAG